MTSASQRVRAEWALAAVTVCWGASFVLVKSAASQISTFLFISIRFTIAAIVLALLFHRRLGRYPNFRRTTLTDYPTARALHAYTTSGSWDRFRAAGALALVLVSPEFLVN